MIDANTTVPLTVEQFQHHIGRAGADWNFSEFCLAVWGQEWPREHSMYLYAQEKFHKVQDIAHFMCNNHHSLLTKVIFAHLAEEARRLD